MKDQLNQLLKNTYTKEGITSQLRRLIPHTEDLKEIESAVEGLPVVIITLANTLTKEDIRQLGQWFRRNVNPQVLLDIHQDPKIVGGCQIIWRGFEGDFSLRRKFQPSFAKATEGKQNG